jgi:hexokinase
MTIPLYTQKELQAISESFTKELDDARDGQSNSLAYLQNPLASSSFLSNSDVVQVMSIGGTLCKTAYIHNHEGVLEFTDYDITSIPLFDTKEHFLSYVTKHIKKDATILALNFAYPMAPILRNEHTDGILLRATKSTATIIVVVKSTFSAPLFVWCPEEKLSPPKAPPAPASEGCSRTHAIRRIASIPSTYGRISAILMISTLYIL